MFPPLAEKEEKTIDEREGGEEHEERDVLQQGVRRQQRDVQRHAAHVAAVRNQGVLRWRRRRGREVVVVSVAGGGAVVCGGGGCGGEGGGEVLASLHDACVCVCLWLMAVTVVEGVTASSARR